MTLFRKVFQSQARPAEEVEMPDPQQLRDAIADLSDEPSPLLLQDEDQVEAFDEETRIDEADISKDPGIPDSDDIVSPDADEHPEEDPEIVDADRPETFARAEAAEYPDDIDDTVADITSILEKTADVEGQNPAISCATVREQTPDDNATDELQMTPDTELKYEVLSNDDGEAETHTSGSDDDLAVPSVLTASPLPVSDDNDPVVFARQQLEALETSTSGDEAAHAGKESGSSDTDFPDLSQPIDLPAPAAGRANRRAGRVKTRLLGFNREADSDDDPFRQVEDTTATPQSEKFPVGWLVIVDGPGEGHAFSIFTGASMIGRGDGQAIRLDFGDNSISRQNHAAIAYDEEVNKFYIGHGGKSNIIRRNARPVLSTEELHHADLLRIGETTLRFVALCGPDFQWNGAGYDDAAGV